VLGAIERRADGWRTNFSRGGRVAKTSLPEDWALLALRAARAVGRTDRRVARVCW